MLGFINKFNIYFLEAKRFPRKKHLSRFPLNLFAPLQNPRCIKKDTAAIGAKFPAIKFVVIFLLKNKMQIN